MTACVEIAGTIHCALATDKCIGSNALEIPQSRAYIARELLCWGGIATINKQQYYNPIVAQTGFINLHRHPCCLPDFVTIIMGGCTVSDIAVEDSMGNAADAPNSRGR